MTARHVFAGRVGAAVLLISRASSAESPATVESPGGARVALVWIYGDDDVLGPSNASEPPSPAASIGDRPGYDSLASGYRSRYTGRENRVELHLRGSAPGFLRSLDTSAELAVGIDATGLGAPNDGPSGAPLHAEDLGSFVEARLALSAQQCASSAPSFLAVRLYPIDGDRERVGWLEALGWGGATGPRRESPYLTARTAVRAGRLSLGVSAVEAFAGLKTAGFVEPVPDAPATVETSYGVFAGIEARPAELVRLGIAGGNFEHGVLESASRGERATTAGGSARVAIQRGMDEPRSPVTFLGHGDDPFRTEGDPPPGAFAVGVEVAGLVQRLRDFDRPGQTTLSPARALALFGGARLGLYEVSGALMLRDPEFVMRNVPGVFPGQTLPSAAQRDFEKTALASIGLVFSEVIRADVALGLRLPAAVMIGALDRLGQPTGATLVVNGPGDVELLPVGTVPVPILDVRPSLEARLSSLVTTVVWIQYRRDYNRTRLLPVAGGSAARGFADPDRVGYGIAARAAW
jgi:hypothetical protein